MIMAMERDRYRRFEFGLRPKIRTLVTTLYARCSYVELVETSLRVEMSLKRKRSITSTFSGERKGV